MNIKTYPLQFTADHLEQIAQIAKSQGKSIKQYILDLIEEDFKKRMEE